MLNSCACFRYYQKKQQKVIIRKKNKFIEEIKIIIADFTTLPIYTLEEEIAEKERKISLEKLKKASRDQTNSNSQKIFSPFMSFFLSSFPHIFFICSALPTHIIQLSNVASWGFRYSIPSSKKSSCVVMELTKFLFCFPLKVGGAVKQNFCYLLCLWQKKNLWTMKKDNFVTFFALVIG